MTKGDIMRDDRSAISLQHKARVDERNAISEHLRSHVHLTNCIHLRNHMHHHSPFPGERSLMRDLIVLQRSRSLRDPSTNQSWLSPSVGTFYRRPTKDSATFSARRSTGVDQPRESRRLSTSSPLAPSIMASKVAAAEARNNDDSGESEDVRRSKGDELGSSKDSRDIFFQRKAGTKAKKVPHKDTTHLKSHFKTLSEQLEKAPMQTVDNKGRYVSRVCQNRGNIVERICEDPDASSCCHCSRSKRARIHQIRHARASRGSGSAKGFGVHSSLSVASNSVAKHPANNTRHIYENEEDMDGHAEIEISQHSINGCGIPLNWSRIHHRSKTFLDMAGRRFTCGLSDSRPKKTEGKEPGSGSQENMPNKPMTSDPLNSTHDSDSEELPLLVEGSSSQRSNANPCLARDHSGELGIFSIPDSRYEENSGIEFEARSGCYLKSRKHHYGRHRSLTQKYMPQTFKDIVGQNFVVQALSNAVLKRKIGLVYIFYGPHGTGKTSCAHVFAKALNCQSMEHPKPCGTCASCVSHCRGGSRNVVEIGPVGNLDFENIMDVLDNVLSPPLSSQYKVFILDGCDTLTPDAWNIISKVVDRAPRHVVFILISSNVDHLPHIIMSRCQKFFFSKLKDHDIISTLRWISTSEGLEIDKAALKIIALRSDGSLRDAEMTLEQLTLLGQRISLPVVQELVGLVSDERLVDLLDLALSSDTSNTVKHLREIIETGVDPLTLMTQLATIITDILAGSYSFSQERVRRKFFRRLALSKEDMEKLRHALGTLSEAEKQLRVSNNKLTWLTAALLQLAPDHESMLSTSSKENASISIPLAFNINIEQDVPRKSSNVQGTKADSERDLLRRDRFKCAESRCANDIARSHSDMGNNHCVKEKQDTFPGTNAFTSYAKDSKASDGANIHKENEMIWIAVLENLHSDSLKQFLGREGKLISVRLESASIVRLMFSSHAKKSTAEKFKTQILRAFERVLHSKVVLEIRSSSKKEKRVDSQVPFPVSSADPGPSRLMMLNQRSLRQGSRSRIEVFPRENTVKKIGSSQSRHLYSDAFTEDKDEITEVGSTHELGHVQRDNTEAERAWVEETSSSQGKKPEYGETARRQSLVKGKVSLAHVIQHADNCTQRSGWSRRKAISIAEKLEHENLRLEPRSRSLLCWRSSKFIRQKLQHLRIRTRRSTMLRFMTCGRCLCSRSPR